MSEDPAKQILAAAKKGDFETLKSNWDRGHRAKVGHILERAVVDFRTVRRNEGHATILKWCIDQGFSLMQRVDWMNQPVICSISMYGNGPIAEYAVKKQPDLVDDPFVAASLARIDVLKSSKEELTNLRDVNEFNLLHYATASGLGRNDQGHRERQREVCQFLIDQNVSTDAEVETEIKLTPALFCAWFCGDAEIMKLLIDAGQIDVSRLHQAVEFAFEPHQRSGDPHVECAEVILNAGFDLNSLREDQGRTLLHGSANRGSKTAVKWLLEQGADPISRDVDQRTPLHAAATRNTHTSVIELLLEFGADRDAVDEDGKTALELATANGREKVANLLSIK